MDPLSVIVSVGAVSKSTFACVKVLGKFLGDTAVVDETVEELFEESNIAKDAWKQFRLDLREDEIKRFRGTFQYNCSGLQTMLVTVSFYVSSTAPRMEADEISSSNCDDSELNSTRARSDSKRKTTGSELGRPLDPEHRARISSWVPRKEAILEGPKIEPDESQDTEWTSTSESATLTPSDDFASDDEELELEVTQKMLMKGRQSLKDEKFTQAEKDISMDIAIACFGQQKLDDTRKLCEGLVNEIASDDADRLRMLSASHLLAQVHLRNGSFNAAISQCKQTIKARKRLDDGSNAYHQSLALLVTIYDMQGDELESTAYASLLPEGYKRPVFQAPLHTSVEGPAKDEALRTLAFNNRDVTLKTFDSKFKKKSFGITTKDLIRRKGVYVDTIGSHNRTPLHIAAAFGYEVTCQILLQRGASTTARQGCYEACAHVDCRSGPTAFEDAIQWKHHEVVKVFLACGAALSPPTLLHYAAFAGNRETLLLLSAKVDVMARDWEGRTPLHYAAESGHDTIIELLMEQGVDVDAVDEKGLTAVGEAALAGHADCLAVLIEHGANMLHRDDDKLTALHHAASKEHEHLLPLLQAHGLDLDARTKTGQVALHYCAWNDWVSFANKLRASGADVHARDSEGRNIQHDAAEGGQERFVGMLLDASYAFAVDERTRDYRTPLMLATIEGHLSVVDLLLGWGANVNARDVDEYSACHYAVQNGYTDIARRLAYAGAEYCKCVQCTEAWFPAGDAAQDTSAGAVPP
ncbi:hypothetical protein B0A55_01830 [Friedmanniomyces simplex]|uniref:Uncharacterized protein n=1 Tax=Friedmanniomyces simplex TaxID=329884 RepID=A0A4U0XJA6_9PEZI|nr:hypothetical protein B0A55_01830 [Friedmanniomyces simplex]